MNQSVLWGRVYNPELESDIGRICLRDIHIACFITLCLFPPLGSAPPSFGIVCPQVLMVGPSLSGMLYLTPHGPFGPLLRLILAFYHHLYNVHRGNHSIMYCVVLVYCEAIGTASQRCRFTATSEV